MEVKFVRAVLHPRSCDVDGIQNDPEEGFDSGMGRSGGC